MLMTPSNDTDNSETKTPDQKPAGESNESAKAQAIEENAPATETSPATETNKDTPPAESAEQSASTSATSATETETSQPSVAPAAKAQTMPGGAFGLVLRCIQRIDRA